MEVNYVPKTLDECFEFLETFLEDKEDFKNCPEDQLMGMCHMSLGMGLRNRWNLWWSVELRDRVSEKNENYPQEMPELVKWFREQGIKVADDMSGVIIRTYHRKLNNVPFDLEGQFAKTIKYYKDKNIELP
jgi:hypothetical protein